MASHHARMHTCRVVSCTVAVDHAVYLLSTTAAALGNPNLALKVVPVLYRHVPGGQQLLYGHV